SSIFPDAMEKRTSPGPIVSDVHRPGTPNENIHPVSIICVNTLCSSLRFWVYPICKVHNKNDVASESQNT
ncbi:MAG: hypothetical protein SVY10_12415, partial [Thermodesulfobacteriota bacterium]|nr:hypothetical protein [Thermodesulfobacteriota bacterium]